MLFCWFSGTGQLSAVECLCSWAQDRTRWPLLYLLVSLLILILSLNLWRETIDNMVSHSMRLRSLLGLPENTTYTDDVPEETGKWKF